MGAACVGRLLVAGNAGASSSSLLPSWSSTLSGSTSHAMSESVTSASSIPAGVAVSSSMLEMARPPKTPLRLLLLLLAR